MGLAGGLRFRGSGGAMLKLGLTGAIASGKSAVGEIFVSLGAHLIQADRIAHDLMLPGQSVYREVVERFGAAILHPDHTIDRAKLAECVFASNTPSQPPRIEELNKIVHPAVLRRQVEWMEGIGREYPHGVAIVEAALILEAGAAQQFDRLAVVTCKQEQRIARFAARQNVDVENARKEVARRMAAQLPEAEKIKAADFVIDNSGALSQTREQVRILWERLISLGTISLGTIL
jgi:dephospho-CoA kinase